MRSQLLKESLSCPLTRAEKQGSLSSQAKRWISAVGGPHTPAVASSVSSMVPGVWTDSLLSLDTDTRGTRAASRFPASYLDTTEPLWDWPEEEEEVVALS